MPSLRVVYRYRRFLTVTGIPVSVPEAPLLVVSSAWLGFPIAPSPDTILITNIPTPVLSEYRSWIAISRSCRKNHHSNHQTELNRQTTNGAMGFFLISLYFVLSGLVGTLGIRVCYNKGPSTNMLNVMLVNTAVICCWLMWAIVWLAQWKPLINPVLKGEGE